MRLASSARTSGLASLQPPKACSCMNRRRSEACWLAPRSRTSTVISSPVLTSASPGVHLEVRIALEAADLHERLAVAQRQPVLGAAVRAGAPAAGDQRLQLLGAGAAAEQPAQVDASRRVETQIPQAVGGEAAAVAVRAEGRGRGRD